MSKFIYLLFIIVCSCAPKTRVIYSNESNVSSNKIDQKREKEFLKYDKVTNTYTLKLEQTRSFTFSLNKDDKNKLYEKIVKENNTLSEAAQNPLVELSENKPSIENYLLNGGNYAKSNLETAINKILKRIESKSDLYLPSGDIKDAFTSSFGNYFDNIYDLSKTEQQKKIELLKILKSLLKDNNTNDFLKLLHIEKIKTNKDTIFLNGRNLNNFDYFDFGIWEQDISVKYNGNEKLKEYYDLKDENTHKFMPFIYADNDNKRAIKQNTSMTFTGSAFAGVTNKDKYKLFYGTADLKVDDESVANIYFDFKDWAQFGFYNIHLNGENFDNKFKQNFSILTQKEGDFKIPDINDLETAKLNGSFYGKDEVNESTGIFKVESKNKSYKIDGVFGVKRNK